MRHVTDESQSFGLVMGTAEGRSLTLNQLGIKPNPRASQATTAVLLALQGQFDQITIPPSSSLAKNLPPRV